MKYTAVLPDSSLKRFEIERIDDKRYRINGRECSVDVVVTGRGSYSILLDGFSEEVTVCDEKGGYLVELGAHRIPVRLEDPFKGSKDIAVTPHEGEAVLVSPMPGRVVGIKAQMGQEVKEGAGVVLIEAMKMENELHSPKSGRVKKISVTVGDAVEAGQELVVIE